MAHSVLATEPQRIVSPIFKVSHIAANQFDLVVVITVGQVIDKTLKSLPPSFHALGLQIHGAA